jgi:hypothetical protein
MSPHTEIPYIEIYLPARHGLRSCPCPRTSAEFWRENWRGVASGVKTGAASGVAWRYNATLCSYSICSAARAALRWAFTKPVSP